MLNPDIRDQAYQFFIEEAPELLEAIESGLLALRQDRSTAKVHEVMRAAHSIKGGAASVQLDAIKTIAHRLETIFKALYDETIEIDTTLESQLLDAYDCLRLPLTEQIEIGQIDEEQALLNAEAVFTVLESRLESALAQADSYIPTSADLGVDMVASIFEIDVAQGLERLTTVLRQPEVYPIAGELQAQAEVFIGLAELLNLPGFGEIAQTALIALERHPEQSLQILKLALADFEAGRNAVLAGDRSEGGRPSAQLIALAQSTIDAVISDVADDVAGNVASGATSAESSDEFSNRFSNGTDHLPITDHLPMIESVFALGDLDTELGAELNPDLGEQLSKQLSSGLDDELINKPVYSLEEGLDDELETNLDTNLLFEEPPNFLELTHGLTSELAADYDTTASLQEEPLALDIFGDISDPLSDQSVGSSAASGFDFSEASEISAEDVFSELSIQDAAFLSAEDTALSDVDRESLLVGNSITKSFSESAVDVTDLDLIGSDLAFSNVEADAISTSNQLENELVDELSSEVIVSELISELENQSVDLAENLVSNLTGNLTSNLTGNLADIIAEITAEEVAADFDPSPLRPIDPISLESAVESAQQMFDQLPSLADQVASSQSEPQPTETQPAPAEDETAWKQYLRSGQATSQAAPANLSVRVDLHRLERMNNLVGELAINRNGLSLQNEQLQGSVRDLVERFERFQSLIGHLQDTSDQMLVAPASRTGQRTAMIAEETTTSTLLAGFDTLEMDRYSTLHFQLQEIFEQVMQLEEALGDISLFSGQSNQTLSEQRQKLTQLQNELMWARMLPLGNVLNRFPRVLRDLSAKYNKPVSLKLTGTSVLVDKLVLEKLYDPLLHLLRNAFDHGIEPPEVRQQKNKPEQGTIEIRAYHRGNQTLIDIVDDGKGLDVQRIGRRAVELGWLSAEALENLKPAQLFDFIFEPGFSTAAQVSELSGRGVGLDVVRAQLRSLKGSVSVISSPNKGTTFTLRIPLTLTIAKLLTCIVGATALAVPSDSIEEILVPRTEQLKQSGKQQFLHWRKQLVPIYRVSSLLDYACVVPKSSVNEALTAVPAPKDWALPLLIIQRPQHSFALEVDRLITEQELVIKPFGSAIAPPAYTYGCTILGDGSLIPVIDAATLVDHMLEPFEGNGDITVPRIATPISPGDMAPATRQAQTILVVDDSATLRRMLALTLEKGGYRVLQARDGQEALTQLQGTSGTSVQLVICDIEMPNMNGFEFLSQRRQHSTIAAIPVVMLTSRNNDKHRRLAMHLGATAYFSKPYIEQDLLSALKNLLEINSFPP